jgi:hypothetical protein
LVCGNSIIPQKGAFYNHINLGEAA